MLTSIVYCKPLNTNKPSEIQRIADFPLAFSSLLKIFKQTKSYLQWLLRIRKLNFCTFNSHWRQLVVGGTFHHHVVSDSNITNFVYFVKNSTSTNYVFLDLYLIVSKVAVFPRVFTGSASSIHSRSVDAGLGFILQSEGPTIQGKTDVQLMSGCSVLYPVIGCKFLKV